MYWLIGDPLSTAAGQRRCKVVRVCVTSFGWVGGSGSQGGVLSIDGSLALPTTPLSQAVTQTEYSVPGLKSCILKTHHNTVKILKTNRK